MIRLPCKPKTELFKINFNLLQVIKLFPYKVCLLNVLNCYMEPFKFMERQKICLAGIPSNAIYTRKKNRTIKIESTQRISEISKAGN